jgi:hypothetical protein
MCIAYQVIHEGHVSGSTFFTAIRCTGALNRGLNKLDYIEAKCRAMRKGIIFFNVFVVLCTALGLGFLTHAFFLGTWETHQDMIAELPWSFMKRFLGFFSIGVFMMLVLVTLTWVFNTSVIRQNPLPLGRLLWQGLTIIAVAIAAGCICFFYFVC